MVYTVTVRNAGPGEATGVEVADLLPTGVSIVSDTPSQGTYNSATGLWVLGSISAAVDATLILTATVDSGTVGNLITNSAAVTASDQEDPDSTPNNDVPAEDDQDSVDVTVAPPLAL